MGQLASHVIAIFTPTSSQEAMLQTPHHTHTHTHAPFDSHGQEAAVVFSYLLVTFCTQYFYGRRLASLCSMESVACVSGVISLQRSTFKWCVSFFVFQ